MGWVETRIQQYNQGEKATWLEKRGLEHANPVNYSFHAVAAIPIIYGLWTHNPGLIFVGILLNLTGHLYCWVRK